MSADFTDVREEIRKVLVDDATLISLLGGQARIFYATVRKLASIPTITYFDSGARPSPNVPFYERDLTFEIWHNSVEKADAIGARIRTLLDKRQVGGTGGILTSGDWRVSLIYFVSDGESFIKESDIVQRVLTFRYLVYDLTQTV